MAEIKREVVTERITVKITYAELSSMFGFTVENLEDYDDDVIRFSVKINDISGYFELLLSSFVLMFINDITEDCIAEDCTVEIENHGDNIQMFIEIDSKSCWKDL